MTGFSSGDPAGARTQDPNIKSVVLYRLSYGILHFQSGIPVLVVQMYRIFLFYQNKKIFLCKKITEYLFLNKIPICVKL